MLQKSNPFCIPLIFVIFDSQRQAVFFRHRHCQFEHPPTTPHRLPKRLQRIELLVATTRNHRCTGSFGTDRSGCLEFRCKPLQIGSICR